MGLEFVERRLYFTGRYFDNLAIDKLLAKGIKAENLNDDVLGRTLDKIYDYGVTELFEEIALSVGFKITFGHSKGRRQDLKQFIIGIVVNQLGMPLFVKPYSGNESDKESIVEMVKKVRESIKSQEVIMKNVIFELPPAKCGIISQFQILVEEGLLCFAMPISKK